MAFGTQLIGEIEVVPIPPPEKIAKLLERVPEEKAWFGNSIGISGNTLVVGSIGRLSEGRASVYHHDGQTWTLDTVLYEENGQLLHRFAESVAVSGDTIVVGSRGTKTDHNSPLGLLPTGAVYVYSKSADGWALQTQLYPDLEDYPRSFGMSLAISGDTILVGDRDSWGKLNGETTTALGGAFVYSKVGSNWTYEKLVPAIVEYGSGFGDCVALSPSGSVALVGAPSADGVVPGSNHGAAFLFERSSEGWSQSLGVHSVMPESAEPFSFASALAVSENFAAIGARRFPQEDIARGAVFLYRKDEAQWAMDTLLLPDPSSDLNSFGSSLALHNGILLVRAFDTVRELGVVLIYAYYESQWIKLTEFFDETDPGFDQRLAYTGGVIVGGNPGSEEGHEQAGRVTLFEPSFYQAPSFFIRPPDTWLGTISSEALLKGAAVGSETVRYQWERSTDEGQTWEEIDGASEASLIVRSDQLGQTSVEYRLVARSGDALAVSNNSNVAFIDQADLPEIDPISSDDVAVAKVIVDLSQPLRQYAVFSSPDLVEWQRSVFAFDPNARTWNVESGTARIRASRDLGKDRWELTIERSGHGRTFLKIETRLAPLGAESN